jgi:hypothetical protein
VFTVLLEKESGSEKVKEREKERATGSIKAAFHTSQTLHGRHNTHTHVSEVLGKQFTD